VVLVVDAQTSDLTFVGVVDSRCARACATVRVTVRASLGACQLAWVQPETGAGARRSNWSSGGTGHVLV